MISRTFSNVKNYQNSYWEATNSRIALLNGWRLNYRYLVANLDERYLQNIVQEYKLFCE